MSYIAGENEKQNVNLSTQTAKVVQPQAQTTAKSAKSHAKSASEKQISETTAKVAKSAKPHAKSVSEKQISETTASENQTAEQHAKSTAKSVSEKPHAHKSESEMTEEEFLAWYDPSKYRHPSVAVDCVVLSGDKVLLVRRGGHPYKGRLALPGGFIEEGESAEQAVRRELSEETGVKLRKLAQFGFASTPGRDPRDWNISLVFTAETDEKPVHGDDAADALFADLSLCGNTLVVGGEKITLDIALNECGELDFDRTKIVKDGVLAFDHAKILAAVLIKKGKNKI